MAITESSILQAGSRVQVRRGPFPSDPAQVGRLGTVVHSSPYQPHKVDVTLDGEARIRTFATAELEAVEDALSITPAQSAAMKRLSRP